MHRTVALFVTFLVASATPALAELIPFSPYAPSKFVIVQNFPAVQTVDGTVQVGNFPAVQQVEVVNSSGGGVMTVELLSAPITVPGESSVLTDSITIDMSQYELVTIDLVTDPPDFFYSVEPSWQYGEGRGFRVMNDPRSGGVCASDFATRLCYISGPEMRLRIINPPSSTSPMIVSSILLTLIPK